MNITTQIAEQIGGDIEKLIKSTAEIQFYAGSDSYKWRDGRYRSTCDVDYNENPKTREELISIFKDHLSSNT